MQLIYSLNGRNLSAKSGFYITIKNRDKTFNVWENKGFPLFDHWIISILNLIGHYEVKMQ